jgi:hypothetical protein
MSQSGTFDNGTSSPDVETLTGNSGGPVGPDSNFDIQIIGSGGVAVAGTPGSNLLTISSSGGGISWNVINASQTMAVNEGYICTSGATISLALPATSAVGDKIEACLDGSTEWVITQPNAATQIRYSGSETTLGVGGTITSTSVGDSITLICETTNARWVCIASIGNLSIA